VRAKKNVSAVQKPTPNVLREHPCGRDGPKRPDAAAVPTNPGSPDPAHTAPHSVHHQIPAYITKSVITKIEVCCYLEIGPQLLQLIAF
jgi:hypothetical protein